LKIIGLDVGTKRIGVAASDQTQLIASALTTIQRKTKQEDIKHIVELADNMDAEEIVVGLPLNMDGTLGPGAKDILELVDELKAATGRKIATWDERLSTLATERMLIGVDMSRKKRKEVIDKLSAQNILQGYLDWKRNK
jgi:putative Holliday junction resolvase